MIKDQKISVIILAAGHSSRMGTPKALLHFTNENLFFEQIVYTYQTAGIHEIVMIVQPNLKKTIDSMNCSMPNNFYLVCNNKPDKGRFFSIHLGIEKLGAVPIFIQNIDNPFITTKLLTSMANQLKEGSYVSPQYQKKGGHPILLSQQVVSNLRTIAPKPETKLSTVLKPFKKISVEVSNAHILTNINTPEQYHECIKHN